MKISFIILSAIAFSLPANAQQQTTDFIEMNNSRRFFNEGHEQIEQQIKLLQDDGLLKVKLPNGELLSPNSYNNFLYTETNLDREFETAIDNSEQN